MLYELRNINSAMEAEYIVGLKKTPSFVKPFETSTLAQFAVYFEHTRYCVCTVIVQMKLQVELWLCC